MTKDMCSIAVIGAGPSSLSQMRAFALAERSGIKIPEIVCFEKQADWGGMWNYTWRTGLDENGEPVHGSMYRQLWSNGPKECLEFSDYTFDKHFSKPISSFPARETLRDYIIGRAVDSNIRRFIKFQTAVRHVEYDEATQKFVVRWTDLTAQKSHVQTFDYVIVAVGHFSVPNAPAFAGLETFPGRVMHSHDFRDAVQFAGQKVLVVGSSYSAEDIALQTHKFGAKQITISYRKKPMGFKWPSNIEEVPLLTRIEGRTVYFSDGSSRSFDAIILSTGYKHHFPFMADNLSLTTANRLYPDNLYKGVFFQSCPRLVYLGMQDLYFSFTLFDAQAWYVRDVILGRCNLPDAPHRARDIDDWQSRESKLKGTADDIEFQAAYVADLLAATDYAPASFVVPLAQLLNAWEHDKRVDLLTYRDKVYASTITGTLAAKNPVTWIRALENSIVP